MHLEPGVECGVRRSLENFVCAKYMRGYSNVKLWDNLLANVGSGFVTTDKSRKLHHIRAELDDMYQEATRDEKSPWCYGGRRASTLEDNFYSGGNGRKKRNGCRTSREYEEADLDLADIWHAVDVIFKETIAKEANNFVKMELKAHPVKRQTFYEPKSLVAANKGALLGGDIGPRVTITELGNKCISLARQGDDFTRKFVLKSATVHGGSLVSVRRTAVLSSSLLKLAFVVFTLCKLVAMRGCMQPSPVEEEEEVCSAQNVPVVPSVVLTVPTQEETHSRGSFPLYDMWKSPTFQISTPTEPPPPSLSSSFQPYSLWQSSLLPEFNTVFNPLPNAYPDDSADPYPGVSLNSYPGVVDPYPSVPLDPEPACYNLWGEAPTFFAMTQLQLQQQQHEQQHQPDSTFWGGLKVSKNSAFVPYHAIKHSLPKKPVVVQCDRRVDGVSGATDKDCTFVPIEFGVHVAVDAYPVYQKSRTGSVYFENAKMMDFKWKDDKEEVDANGNAFKPKFKVCANDKACQTDFMPEWEEECSTYWPNVENAQQTPVWVQAPYYNEGMFQPQQDYYNYYDFYYNNNGAYPNLGW